MNVPQVSVVVPTQNGRPCCGRTLGTVLGQKGVALEVIVVDEACEDDTARMLASLGEPSCRSSTMRRRKVWRRHAIRACRGQGEVGCVL